MSVTVDKGDTPQLATSCLHVCSLANLPAQAAFGVEALPCCPAALLQLMAAASISRLCLMSQGMLALLLAKACATTLVVLAYSLLNLETDPWVDGAPRFEISASQSF